jgi:hypothetical protein
LTHRTTIDVNGYGPLMLKGETGIIRAGGEFGRHARQGQDNFTHDVTFDAAYIRADLIELS